MTNLKLYNTRTRKLDIFVPLKKDQVGLYTCGPTVYGTAHIGNLRTYIFEDILRRTLTLNGYNVKHVMNITDVGHLTDDGDMGDDKVEAQAKKEKTNAADITALHEQEFFADLEKLNILKADTILHATKTIDLQVTLIKRLEDKGMTYRTSDGIYFDTSKFPRYGELSGQKSADKKVGTRVEVNNEKKHPTDFALWKFSKPADQRQMEWPSPWGVGFPGWHIECSAMSMHELGDQFDVHTGGVDHIAVHHENEIAQSEAATGKHPFVKYWLHGEFLVLPEKRMGKSEGNAMTLKETIKAVKALTLGEMLKNSPALAFRYLVLQTHYRKPLSFTTESLKSAGAGLNNIYAIIDNTEQEAGQGKKATDEKYLINFREALNDDLNTAKALAVMQELLKSSRIDWGTKRATLEVFDSVLGLDLLKQTKQQTAPTLVEGHESLLKDYEVARAEKRFGISDKIRADFAAKGLIVEDLPDGTSRLRKK